MMVYPHHIFSTHHLQHSNLQHPARQCKNPARQYGITSVEGMPENNFMEFKYDREYYHAMSVLSGLCIGVKLNANEMKDILVIASKDYISVFCAQTFIQWVLLLSLHHKNKLLLLPLSTLAPSLFPLASQTCCQFQIGIKVHDWYNTCQCL